MTTLTELADQAWAREEEKIFFRVNGSSHTYRVYLTRHRNPTIFFAFNTGTQCFEWVKGETVVSETTAPRGLGYRGFEDLKPVSQPEEEVTR